MHWAARYNNSEMVKKLIELDIRIEAKDMEGMTAIDLAKVYDSK